MAIPIIYEDRHILLCSKPAGLLSQEGGMPDRLRSERGGEIFCVHRLDRAVGGLMVYARSAAAAARLSAMLADRQLKKQYLAAAQGRPETDRGQMRDLLYHDAGRNKSYVVSRPRRGVKEAELEYELLESREGLSLMRISLLTGRSHQIRVQLATRGMPLAGDVKYGSVYREHPIALWSEALSFPHPISGKAMSFSLPPPLSPPWTIFQYLSDKEK